MTDDINVKRLLEGPGTDWHIDLLRQHMEGYKRNLEVAIALIDGPGPAVGACKHRLHQSLNGVNATINAINSLERVIDRS